MSNGENMKAEIERLKAENELYCKQINQAYDTGYNDGYESCQDEIKQANIEVLNEVKKRIYDISPYNPFVTKDNVKHFIDELIKEIEYEN